VGRRGDISNVLEKDSVKRECEESLRRLQTDVIDLYQIHWPRPDEDIKEGWSALVELRD
jgi:aryl-alcohol dehydrogenase-like predicted oxidoreductase